MVTIRLVVMMTAAGLFLLSLVMLMAVKESGW
jgi:hypothetical protein